MNFSDNMWYILAVIATSILLLASTIYTLRNILKIWRKGSPTHAEKNSETENSVGTFDDKEPDTSLARGIFRLKLVKRA